MTVTKAVLEKRMLPETSEPTDRKLILGLTQSPADTDPKFAVTVPDEHGSQDACPVTSLYVPWSQI